MKNNEANYYTSVFGNTATIRKHRKKPYNDANFITDLYRVTIRDDENFTFHVSCFETEQDALNDLYKHGGKDNWKKTSRDDIDLPF